MPELPDIVVYIERLDALLRGQTLRKVRLKSPFLVRSYEPPLGALEGVRIVGFRRMGKRIVFECEGELFMVVHLMIAGRFRWQEPAAKLPGRVGLLALDFDHGSLLLTEAGTKRRASVHVVRGAEALAAFDRGGVECLTATLEEFRLALERENRTLKRWLTDPRLVSGVGNAYSDEILHRARLSPVELTARLSLEKSERLFLATREVLESFTRVLRSEVGDGFPEKVTAFRDDMAVHGRYGKPCPVCGTEVQRIRYADNEMNYCPRCQRAGKLLADRSLSRLLKGDWPRSIEELEERKRDGRSGLA